MAAQVIGAVVRGIGRGGGPIHPRCRIGGRVMRGVAVCVLDDREVTVREMELLRAMGDTINCPIPPLLQE